MRINIECTAVEYASIVRTCERIKNSSYGSCTSCLLSELCAERGDQAGVEHVVSVNLDDDSAEDEPVVHAHWVDDRDGIDISFGECDPDCHCSACGKKSDRYFKRCPECGAYMDEGGAGNG